MYCGTCTQSRHTLAQHDTIESPEHGIVSYLTSFKCITCGNYLTTESYAAKWFVYVYRRKHGMIMVDEKHGPYDTKEEAFQRAQMIPEPHVTLEQGRDDG